jgi:DNA-directed RNA polymerase specialized sigma24 family protein
MQHALNLNLDILKPIFDFELFKIKDQDKDDVKQTAILRILDSLRKYDSEQLPEDKLFSFAQVIVKRTVVDYYRRANRKIETSSALVHWSDDVDDETGAGGAGAFSTSVNDLGYSLAGVRIDYRRNAHKFTPQERKVIEYLLFNDEAAGMNKSEISAKLGIHKSHATRALDKLREVCADR